MVRIIPVFILLLGFANLSFAQAQIEIKESWVRATPPGSSITALYMNIENKGEEDDTLLSASANISESAEIHKTTVDENDVAKMEMLKTVTIPAGDNVLLEPGGLHIMLIDLKKPLEIGDQAEIELTFDKAGLIKSQAQVVGVSEKTQDLHQH